MKLSIFTVFFRRYPLELTAIGIGIIFIISGIVLLRQHFNGMSQAVEVVSIPKDPPKNQELFIVEAAGAVVKPGVYTMSPDERVHDLIQKAGGFTGDAAKAVQEELNLAAHLEDTGKIFIPTEYQYQVGTRLFYTSQHSHGIVFTGEVQEISEDTFQEDVSPALAVIDINTATQSELDTLPGIGQKTAEKIIGGRPFSSLDDMVAEKVVNRSVADTLQDLVTFSP